MYCYIYDAEVQDRKYERELIAIEHRITDLGLQGKIVRLALFRDPDEQIRKEVAAGAKTVVVIGNDQTVHRVLTTIVDAGATLAIIPVGEPNVLARILGVPKGVQACDTLSQRIIESLDVGNINGQRFLTGVRFPKAITRVRYGKAYDLVSNKTGQLEILNLSVEAPSGEADIANPIDGKLQVTITTQKRKGFRSIPAVTTIPFEAFEVLYDTSVKAVADGVEIEGDRFNVTTEQGALNVVVSRERMF
ncbi:hypothetical protein COV06_04230 [Candidatus Uhrbacteria bacterium CG10_big_fil_rev_8_21_14_0_10_50_16]|uniref:DAGKc domain-containing protein n=1 Tax=Candidatus Uhrbacteria bacterium CG10_big_fil_rev_8_21_14_0_10_50_16 TaxID=1975039 RepID=A0A2H0RMP7_9BACT|nr:MAG: hypothetical protein COV06_04230 [Candidatus Uhrbacteria bacterium CG10_big_fil_rev_8_21_14_0_10_50_16]